MPCRTHGRNERPSNNFGSNVGDGALKYEVGLDTPKPAIELVYQSYGWFLGVSSKPLG